MIHEIFTIKNHGKQIPSIKTHILQKNDNPKSEKRPFILIIPGGGYDHYGRHEQEEIALKMLSLGFSCAVLQYSLKPTKFPEPLLDAAEAVAFVRKNAAEWNIDENKITVLGFSAGGHLAATLGAYWNSRLISQFTDLKAEQIKPNFLALCYPVITAEKDFCHEGSVNALLENLTENEKQNLKKLAGCNEIRDVFSVEKHISKDFPPSFVWHTLQDEAVPAENTIFLIQSLRREKIDFEYHLFNRGKHGLALSAPQTSNADGSNIEKECEIWPELFKNWITPLLD